MFEVLYHTDPDKPSEFNHMGKYRRMIGQGKQEFNTVNEAISFWFECTNPITTISQLLGDKCDVDLLVAIEGFYQLDNEFLAIVQDNEEVISEQQNLKKRLLYNLIDGDELL